MKKRNSLDSVTVVTATRGRPDKLARAIRSIQKQDYSGELNHLILCDDCKNTITFLDDCFKPSPRIRWQLVPRLNNETSGPSRLALLWNMGVAMSRSEWVSFLDDDNEFDPEHISSLVACAKTSGCNAVHSQRRLYFQDGQPYLDPVWPWCRDEKDGRRAYKYLCDKGVLEPGSNIERDRVDPLDAQIPHPIRIVDTSEWLLQREIINQYPFCTEYSPEDWVNITCGDDKLLQTLVEQRVEIACTQKATLKYYLGGFSNNFHSDESNEAWREVKSS